MEAVVSVIGKLTVRQLIRMHLISERFQIAIQYATHHFFRPLLGVEHVIEGAHDRY